MLAWDRYQKNRDTFINNCSQRFDIGTLYIIGCWDDNKKEIFIKIRNYQSYSTRKICY